MGWSDKDEGKIRRYLDHFNKRKGGKREKVRERSRKKESTFLSDYNQMEVKLPPNRSPPAQDVEASPEKNKGNGSLAESGSEIHMQEGAKGKLQKTDGAFSGDSSMPPREEAWMNDEEMQQETHNQNRCRIGML